MSFNQSNIRLDDFPKTRVKTMAPGATCKAVHCGGSVAGFLVELEGRVIGKETTAYGAWPHAEAALLVPMEEPRI